MLTYKTIGESLEECSRLFPDKIAIIYENSSYTWSQVNLESNLLAYQMHKMGIRKLTKVAIWSVNRPEWIFTYLALVKLGAVPVLVNTCYQEQELIDLLDYADVEYLYYGDSYKEICYQDIVTSIKNKNCTKVKEWIALSDIKTDKTSHLDAWLFVAATAKKIGAGDVAGMLFTSGTTSKPKGVLLTHLNLVNTALSTIQSMGWEAEDRICITVPLFHCFGLTSSMLTTILLGGSMCLLPYYRTIRVLESIQEHRCTVINGVPSMFLAMTRNPDFDQYDKSSLKSGIIAGSPLFPEEYKRLAEKLQGVRLTPSYGQTETSPAVSFTLPGDSIELCSKSAGKIIRGIKVRIADPNTGEVMKTDETGEIQVKGFNVMRGYYCLSEATKRTFTEDGWLHTGDLGVMDAEGYLYVRGRIKEVIIRAGENISPREIEEVLLENPDIVQAAVFGVPAEVIQEQVVACIICRAGARLQEKELQEQLALRLSHYKIPEHILLFDKFPVTASGKVKIQELKDLAIKQLSAI